MKIEKDIQKCISQLSDMDPEQVCEDPSLRCLQKTLKKHATWMENPERGKKADFAGRDLLCEVFRDVDISFAVFTGADCSMADFTKAVASSTVFKGTNLTKAVFNDAQLNGADMSWACLKEAQMNHADLRGTVLSFADLSFAHMEESLMAGSNLRMSNLNGADLRNVDLSITDLTGAVLNSADLKGATLSSWPLWKGSLRARIDEETAMQMLYHLLSCVSHSEHIGETIKKQLLTEELTGIANRYHKAKEYGYLRPEKKKGRTQEEKGRESLPEDGGGIYE